MSTKVDLLILAAHPDDAELSCSGTIIKHIAQGKKVAIVDFTQGELGTRGSAALRLEEAADAQKVLGVHFRENLGLRDGYFDCGEENRNKLISMIRKYQPEIVIANAVSDRHPDHGRGAQLASEACFYSGLRRIETFQDNQPQDAWRPKAIYHYIQDYYIKPDFIVDITPFMDQKIDAIKAFKSQFYDPNSKEPASPISGKEFFDFIKARNMQFGRLINTLYGEGFTVERPMGVDDITLLK